ncbi:MAG: hydroxymethylglutaryl-CoA reductase [Bacteroidota bacterium]
MPEPNHPFSFNDAHKRRISRLGEAGHKLVHLSGKAKQPEADSLIGNIENFIGMAQVPVGLAGPLRMQGMFAQGDFHIPLATTEGALVASYSRGMKAITASGGASAIILDQGVQRAPYFSLPDLKTALQFVSWVEEHFQTFVTITSQNSRFAILQKITPFLNGNAVTLMVEFTTGDAAGQNMVTICTDRICRHIVANFPATIRDWYIEANASGDKKASRLSFQGVRGKKVSVEVIVPKEVVASILKTTPKAMAHYARAATYDSLQSGTLGVQAHCANGLAALFIATGQDAACVAEAAIGLIRLEETGEGDLYASGTFPNLIVGTVGGGTGLPTQRECLELMDCYGDGKSGKLAEITAGVCLAGELSILAALAAGHFTQAHEALGRKG